MARISKEESQRKHLQSLLKKKYILFLSRECTRCGDLVRGEHMWHYKTGGSYSDGNFYCLSCMPTYADFLEHIIQVDNRFKILTNLWVPPSWPCVHCGKPVYKSESCDVNGKYKFHKECFIEVAGVQYL